MSARQDKIRQRLKAKVSKKEEQRLNREDDKRHQNLLSYARAMADTQNLMGSKIHVLTLDDLLSGKVPQYIQQFTESAPPPADETVRKIQEAPAFKKRNAEERSVLETLIKISAARIYYNEVFAKFYSEEPLKNLQKYLTTIFGDSLHGQECPLEGVRALKELLPPGAKYDADVYAQILKIAYDNLSKDNLFEMIALEIRKKKFEIEKDEAYSEPDSEQGLLSAYRQSSEYKECREYDHLDEIDEAIKPYLSDCYKAFWKHHSFHIALNQEGLRDIHSPSPLFILKNLTPYIDSIKIKFKAFDTAFNTLIQDGSIERKELDEILGLASLNTAYTQAILKLDLNKSLLTFDDMFCEFKSIYSFEKQLDEYSARLELFIKKRKKPSPAPNPTPSPMASPSLTPMPNPSPSPRPSPNPTPTPTPVLTPQADPSKLEAKSDNAPPLQHHPKIQSNTKQGKPSNQGITDPKADVYFQYKTALNPNLPVRPRRLSSESATVLNLLLNAAESELPDFGVKRNQLNNLFDFLGGIVNSSCKGSRMRYQLKDIWADIPSDFALPQHKNHGGDNRNDMVSKYTLLQFRSLLKRAHVNDELLATLNPGNNLGKKKKGKR